MQSERLVAVEPLHAFLAVALVIGAHVFKEVGSIVACPLLLGVVPPDQRLALAPGFAIRRRGCAVINDAAVVRPSESPAMPEFAFRFALVGFVQTNLGHDAAIDPAATGCGAVIL